MRDKDTTVEALRQEVHQLCLRKEWGDQGIQNPQQLAMAMTVEMSEVLEHFQWLSPQGVARLIRGDDPKRQAQIAEEMADVMMYALQISKILNIDITDQVLRKIAIVDRRPNSRRDLMDQGGGELR